MRMRFVENVGNILFFSPLMGSNPSMEGEGGGWRERGRGREGERRRGRERREREGEGLKYEVSFINRVCI